MAIKREGGDIDLGDLGGKKRPRTFKDGDWECTACGNMNYFDREVCNMKKCGAPRPQFRPSDWFCGSCGNMNYADREFCNMRKCGASRYGGKSAPPNQRGKGAPTFGPTFGGLSSFMNAMAPMMESFSWGGKAFGKPAGKGFGGYGMPFGKAGGGIPRTSPMMTADVSGKGGGGAVVADGWTCQHCQNVNFKDRAFCNMKVCQAVRPLNDWSCATCGNNNYADRVVCNMRSCGARRTDIDERAVQEIIARGGIPKQKGTSKGKLTT